MYAVGPHPCAGFISLSSAKHFRAVCVSSLRELSSLKTLSASGAHGSHRDFVCYGSGRPDRRGRRDLPYIRKMSRDRQEEYERREVGLEEEEEEEEEDEGMEEESSDLEDKFGVAEELRKAGKGLGKLPIESNGPPLLILHPYISDEKPVKEKFLRPLPLPSPHKLRPLRLPRPSVRRKLGAVVPKNDSRQAIDFIRNLAAQIRSLPDEVPVSELMDKWGWKLRRGALSRTVKDLGRMKLTDRVLQILTWVQGQPNLWPDDITLSAIINVMVGAGEIEIAVQLQLGVGRDSVKAAQTLASALANIGLLEEAVKVVSYMIDAGWKVDGFVYRRITHWACRTGSRDFAARLWKSVKLSDLKLQLQDYTSIMASCSKLGLYDIVYRLYQAFVDSGLQPNIVFYSTMLSVLSRQGRYREAVAMFWEMEETGCEPDLMAYEIMLDVCAKLEDFTKALKVYKDLKNAGYSQTPNSTLVQLLVKKGLLSRTKDMAKEVAGGNAPSAQTLSSVYSCLMRLAAEQTLNT